VVDTNTFNIFVDSYATIFVAFDAYATITIVAANAKVTIHNV